MQDLVMMVIGVQMEEKMTEKDVFNRVEAAETDSEKFDIVRETESDVFDVIGDVFKSEDELPPEGIEAKDELTKAVLENQYEYFNLSTPFNNGDTLDTLKERNGIALR
ncbi:hypothetical protein [Halobacillus ihumii]|uniref:hypothetical protein n=1 Tax=Halobacillus ihumii TaxID=2686092 RepID=UPI0013D0B8EA|nr:hypothetical protein [Halobacillus ihumii]